MRRPATDGRPVLLRAVVTWLGLGVVAIGNGVEAVVSPRPGPAGVHGVNTLLLCGSRRAPLCHLL